MCGYAYVWVFVMCICACVSVGFVMCGCFGNMCTCYLLCFVLFVLFHLCIFILICFIHTSVSTTAPSDNSNAVTKQQQQFT
jgi:hypothetical protein